LFILHKGAIPDDLMPKPDWFDSGTNELLLFGASKSENGDTKYTCYTV
jgi:hypothetical protein